jgi:hypothetical protein
MTAKRVAIFFTAMLFVFFAPAVDAANVIEKLMMPGELSQAHAKFEENCQNCHKVLVKEAQSGLCLDCHKETKQDVALKRGFHGKDSIVDKSECFSCHVEHKGRDWKIVTLEPLLFNHENTEYPLTMRRMSLTKANWEQPVLVAIPLPVGAPLQPLTIPKPDFL